LYSWINWMYSCFSNICLLKSSQPFSRLTLMLKIAKIWSNAISWQIIQYVCWFMEEYGKISQYRLKIFAIPTFCFHRTSDAISTRSHLWHDDADSCQSWLGQKCPIRSGWWVEPSPRPSCEGLLDQILFFWTVPSILQLLHFLNYILFFFTSTGKQFGVESTKVKLMKIKQNMVRVWKTCVVTDCYVLKSLVAFSTAWQVATWHNAIA